MVDHMATAVYAVPSAIAAIAATALLAHGHLWAAALFGLIAGLDACLAVLNEKGVIW